MLKLDGAVGRIQFSNPGSFLNSFIPKLEKYVVCSYITLVLIISRVKLSKLLVNLDHVSKLKINEKLTNNCTHACMGFSGAGDIILKVIYRSQFTIYIYFSHVYLLQLLYYDYEKTWL